MTGPPCWQATCVFFLWRFRVNGGSNFPEVTIGSGPARAGSAAYRLSVRRDFGKLIRDRIPEIIEALVRRVPASGLAPKTRLTFVVHGRADSARKRGTRHDGWVAAWQVAGPDCSSASKQDARDCSVRPCGGRSRIVVAGQRHGEFRLREWVADTDPGPEISIRVVGGVVSYHDGVLGRGGELDHHDPRRREHLG
jgi:hypothetical protein